MLRRVLEGMLGRVLEGVLGFTQGGEIQHKSVLLGRVEGGCYRGGCEGGRKVG